MHYENEEPWPKLKSAIEATIVTFELFAKARTWPEAEQHKAATYRDKLVTLRQMLRNVEEEDIDRVQNSFIAIRLSRLIDNRHYVRITNALKKFD